MKRKNGRDYEVECSDLTLSTRWAWWMSEWMNLVIEQICTNPIAAFLLACWATNRWDSFDEDELRVSSAFHLHLAFVWSITGEICARHQASWRSFDSQRSSLVLIIVMKYNQCPPDIQVNVQLSFPCRFASTQLKMHFDQHRSISQPVVPMSWMSDEIVLFLLFEESISASWSMSRRVF